MNTRGLNTPSVDAEPSPTRRPLSTWDRSKFLILFAAIWGVLAWNLYIEDPNITFADTIIERLRSGRLWLALFTIETIRQFHYLLSENWSAWHLFWSVRVFGGFERRAGRLNDWNRYRLGRALRILAGIVVLSYVLGEIYDVPPTTALFELPRTIWSFLPFALQLAFILLIAVGQFVAIFWFLSRGGVDVYFPEDIKTRFTDVWGQDNVLERVKENMVFLDDPDSIESKGGYVPQGILLWGPPGTGKTLMAEAVAGETGKPFVFVEPGAFINMFMGVGILKVKALFRKLRKLAVRYGGVIVFFDEADALGNRGALPQGGWGGQAGASPWDAPASGCNGLAYLAPAALSMVLGDAAPSSGERAGGWRDRIVMGGFGGSGGMGTLQALLTELSGLKKPRGFFNRIVRRALGMRPKPPPHYRILVMMATNMPQALDEALLRPGRLDRIYKVGYPSKAGRIRTYEGYLERVSHELTPDEIDKLATITPYATGATIKDLVNEALINAIRDDRDTIVWKDIVKAKQLKELGPPEDVEYIERERHAVAVHEACHAVVAHHVRHHLNIDIATIEKGGTYLGMVASIPPEDQFTHWRSEFEADIMTSLASLAGERMFFEGDNSSGVSGDLNTATLIATYMEGYWGMGRTVASHGVNRELGIVGGPPGGKGADGRTREEQLLASGLGQRIESKLVDLLERTEALLSEKRGAVLAVTHALETHKTLTGEDVEAIIEGRRGPLIDGRSYASRDFQDAAEKYHAEAVAAHRDHAKIAMPMPDAREFAASRRSRGNGTAANGRRSASRAK